MKPYLTYVKTLKNPFAFKIKSDKYTYTPLEKCMAIYLTYVTYFCKNSLYKERLWSCQS